MIWVKSQSKDSQNEIINLDSIASIKKELRFDKQYNIRLEPKNSNDTVKFWSYENQEQMERDFNNLIMLLNEQCLLIDLSDVTLLLTEEEMEVI